MEIEHLPLAGALMLTPKVFSDERGFFKETYSSRRYHECGITDEFLQDNLSLSRRNVLRGLHGDARMAKLVEVIHGRAFDVIVDFRPDSATYLRWHASVLSPLRGEQIYIPVGFLHGFLALEDETIVAYKQTAAYDPAAEFTVAWNDPDLAIEWPLRAAPVLSPRDAASPTLRSRPVA
ncbi:MAG: dTDP-4-dehydrorhamnose 3,5-epimerase [Candidatus Eremiobacteraeota bacterium]|nr:dTDP-4-dehydrorhamnose 3,5-epimerase [Candidatus Eremiobacteraeota bacterium]MBV9055141.1 dTDP-4-dehydrorhamnose 3,5-epimerase [Candidatus Eremiobacteraeota bacterium]